MQVLIIAGNVGKDAELRRTGSGDAVLGFSVAVDQGKDANGNKRDAMWVDCSVWGKRAESLQNYIVKGTKLSLQGRPTVREHNGKAYLGLSVSELTFQGGGQQGGSSGGNHQESERQGGYGGRNASAPIKDDDIPF